MKHIAFSEAQALLKDFKAGFYCVNGTNLRAHPQQTVLFSPSREAWFLVPYAELRLVDEGIVGDDDTWCRKILVHCEEGSQMAQILQDDLIEVNRLHLPKRRS